MTTTAFRYLVAIALVLTGVAARAEGADKDKEGEARMAELRALPWQNGPAKGSVGSKASLDIPQDVSLLDESKGARFLELLGNLPEPGNTILTFDKWWATFSFTDSGYVKDDEKLDPDGLLAQIKSGDEASNEERRKRGIPQLYTDGWAVKPHYDKDTKRLEWGLNLRVEGQPEPVVNYTVRVLGRSGYENVTLVSMPQDLNEGVARMKAILGGFDFVGGERYAEFKAGDRVAEIGLGALVVGGAAAAAVKSGLWKTILAALVAGWKFVLAGGAALLYGLKKVFTRNKSGDVES